MRTIKSPKGTEIKLFSSARELTILRWNEFQKYMVKECSVEALSFKIERSIAFIQEKRYDEALVENKNALFCLNNAMSGVGYQSYAFAVLVAEIGGKTCLDISEDGLRATILELDALGFTIGEIDYETNLLKKK